MRLAPIASLVLLGACGKPVTEEEALFIHAVLTEFLDDGRWEEATVDCPGGGTAELTVGRDVWEQQVAMDYELSDCAFTAEEDPLIGIEGLVARPDPVIRGLMAGDVVLGGPIEADCHLEVGDGYEGKPYLGTICGHNVLDLGLAELVDDGEE